MKLPRRKFLHLAAGAAALPAVSRFACAESYPSRPVRLTVGFPPAGAGDITARLIGQWLSERLGQQFIVENRPGAGATLATEAVAKASPDGYTLLLTGSVDAWNATLYGNLKFNYIRDIVPVASISRGMGVLGQLAGKKKNTSKGKGKGKGSSGGVARTPPEEASLAKQGVTKELAKQRRARLQLCRRKSSKLV
jgi:tripartite-type tricarboxylate transporter receptor subunit TctC